MYLGVWLWLLTLLAAGLAADPGTWGDWLIVDEAEPGTSVLLRRITPKSVFVAPTFNGCSDGYTQDSLGRCVKLVKVNQQAQWNFFLERLNSMYAPSSTSKRPQKEAGPFHINLPLGGEDSKEVMIKKRLPEVMQQSTTIRSTLVPTTTTTRESTTTEVTQQTMFDTSTTADTESTTETKRDVATTTEVMLGDQPATTEADPPKNPTQLPAKPFVIIVTNEPTTRTEETMSDLTTSFSPLLTEEDTQETSSTTEVTTTETISRFVTESTMRTTEYDESLSETKDILQSSLRPTENYRSSTVRPWCDPSLPQGCDLAETEIVSGQREVTNPSISLPASLPLLEPSTQVRFPSDTFAPVQKSQSFVRFPEAVDPHDDRPSVWWPSWQVRRHPDIRGWPSAEDSPSERKQQHVFRHPDQPWADSVAWRRRFFQRD